MSPPLSLFAPGRLWSRVTATSERALANHDLHTIPTDFVFLTDTGVDFLVRRVSRRRDKYRAGQETLSSSPERRNPFLPYDPRLFVADASSTHVCLLNKFNVVDHHLLIVTREFQDQRSKLDQRDFSALARCMAEYDGLGLYNSGAEAGASQPHKHLQLVPLPLADRGPRLPIESRIGGVHRATEILTVDTLPFPHALSWLDERVWQAGERCGNQLFHVYSNMLTHSAIAITAGSDGLLEQAYNLLLTRQWMLMVPRFHERFEGISLNAMAFAGALLVRDSQQLQILRDHGPGVALTYVSTPACNS